MTEGVANLEEFDKIGGVNVRNRGDQDEKVGGKWKKKTETR